MRWEVAQPQRRAGAARSAIQIDQSQAALNFDRREYFGRNNPKPLSRLCEPPVIAALAVVALGSLKCLPLIIGLDRGDVAVTPAARLAGIAKRCPRRAAVSSLPRSAAGIALPAIEKHLDVRITVNAALRKNTANTL